MLILLVQWLPFVKVSHHWGEMLCQCFNTCFTSGHNQHHSGVSYLRGELCPEIHLCVTAATARVKPLKVREVRF